MILVLKMTKKYHITWYWCQNIRDNMVEKRVKRFGQGPPPPLFGQCDFSYGRCSLRIWQFANVGGGGFPFAFSTLPLDSFLSQASGTDGVNLTRINESNWTKNLSTWHLWSCQMDVCSSVCCSGGWTLSLLVILCHQQVLHWLFGLPLIGDVWASWAPGPPFAFRTHGPPQY